MKGLRNATEVQPMGSEWHRNIWTSRIAEVVSVDFLEKTIYFLYIPWKYIQKYVKIKSFPCNFRISQRTFKSFQVQFLKLPVFVKIRTFLRVLHVRILYCQGLASLAFKIEG